jgi:hypothetical protein
MWLAFQKIPYSEDTPLVLLIGLLVLSCGIVFIRRGHNRRYSRRVFQLIYDGKNEQFLETMTQDIETAISSAVRSNLELKLGMGLLLMGRWKEARTALALIDSSYIQENSRRWFHMSNLQVLLHTDQEDANRYFVRNHEHFIPDSPNTLINQAIRLHNGMVEFLIKQDPHAEKIFLALTSECKDAVIKSRAYYFLARMEHDREQPDAAQAFLEQSKQISPEVVHGPELTEPWIQRGRAVPKA